MAGLSAVINGPAGLRLEIGFPLGAGDLPGLRLVVPLFFFYQSETVPYLDDSISVFIFSPNIGIQYDYVIPINSPNELAILGELTAGPWFAWWSFPDLPFRPGETQEHTDFAMRIAGAVQYRLVSGWIFSLQPFGLLIPLTGGEVAYEVELTAGFQFE